MFSEKTRPKRRPTAIGVRLTLWGMGMTLAVCVLLCVVLYVGMYYSLLREVDAFLQDEVQELAAKVREHAGDHRAAERAIRDELGHRTREDLSFRLFDPQDNVLISSDAEDTLWTHLRGALDGARRQQGPYFETVRFPGVSSPSRTCSVPLDRPNQPPLVAQTTYSLHRMKHSLALLRKISAGGLALVAVFALAGGWILTRRSLRPIDTMTRKARRITASRLSDRLPRSGTGDELDRLAETLNDMLDRIQDHVRRIRQFTADASHEFRSPLAALRGMAEVALTKPRSADELRQVIEVSIEQYDRLQRLAEDLLLLAQADANRAGLRRELLRLDSLVRDTAEFYAPVADEAGLTFTVEAPQNIEIHGDAGRLRQMLGNLIDNAIKYSQAPATIDVTLACLDGAATITVRDTGPGIAPNDLPRVFDRFYRSDKARTSPGTGLGLAIAQWIAHAHGGTIEITGDLGKGTTAKVHLPIPPAQAS
ncbi:MAG: heavy metal sensor histidine kinase [Phycisphaerae bacterium]|nr:heavy metal sensor histidine kinase [Phycisphaerae bacterium]